MLLFSIKKVLKSIIYNISYIFLFYGLPPKIKIFNTLWKKNKIYEVDLDIIKNVIKDCDGNLQKITNNDKIYMLIPSC